MTVGWTSAVAASVAASTALLWPLTSAIPMQDAWPLRFAAAAVASILYLAAAAARGVSPRVWTVIGVASAAAGVSLLMLHLNARAECLAEYEGRAVIIGREYLPEAAAYVAKNPALSVADLVFDAGGVPGRIWTPASIRACTHLVGAAGLAAIPCAAHAVAAVIARQRRRLLPRRPSAGHGEAIRHRPGSPIPLPIYDAFLSYRHCEADRTHAVQVLESLENRGLDVAVDFRDFAANEHFLSEMERCIRESRFVLCVITAHYLESGHTSEEAIISKTLDMADRRKRLVPLIFERVDLPVWLHGLVGIDFTPSAAVDPFERLYDLIASSRAQDRDGPPTQGGSQRRASEL